MFEKVKKQKQEKSNRNNLKIFMHLLEDSSTLLTKNFPDSPLINMLRIVTCIELNYLTSIFFAMITKANDINIKLGQSSNNMKLEDVKIGIIGGGIMGRLFLNGLLIHEKDGLLAKNISISTRQVEDLQQYSAQFGVNVCFDNQAVALDSDILIIAVPSTLDNWIINDLKQPLNNRIGDNSKKVAPLVFITTSNMHTEKLSRLFNFPIITPACRGENKAILKELTKFKEIEQIEKHIAPIILEKSEVMIEALKFSFLKYIENKQMKMNTTILSENSNASKKILSQKNTTSQEIMDIVEEVMASHESPENTFAIHCRKWRIAYSNYIA